MRLLLFNMVTDAEHPVQGFTTAWITALARHCQTIDVISMLTGRLHLPENVRVHSVGKEKGFSELRRAIEFYRHLWRILQYKPIDACFVHMIPLFAAMGAPLLKAKGIPITFWYTHKSVTPLLWVTEKLVDRVVTASAESFRVSSRKVIVTGHGIDTKYFKPAVKRREKKPFTILSVSRIAPVKRLEVLIEAFSILDKELPHHDLRLRLVGNVYEFDQTYATSLRKLVISKDLQIWVEFSGPVPYSEVASEYQQSDVFVNLSDTDSLDKAVLEAMSCGIPVITSNIAFKAVLADLSDDLLIPKNSPKILADRLMALYDKDPEERATLGQRLRELVNSQHSLERLAKHLVNELL